MRELLLLPLILSAATVVGAAENVIVLTAPAYSADLVYSDDVLDVGFSIEERACCSRDATIFFLLRNRGGVPILIDWDACSITNTLGLTGNIMHSGPGGATEVTIPPESWVAASVTSADRYPLGVIEGAEFGLYVSIYVGDEQRGYDFRFRVAKRDNCPPHAKLWPASYLDEPRRTLKAIFYLRAGDCDGSLVQAVLNFGDGTSTSYANPQNLRDATHTYAKAGSYTATLWVMDDAGATATDAVVVRVPLPNPEADERAVLWGLGLGLGTLTGLLMWLLCWLYFTY